MTIFTDRPASPVDLSVSRLRIVDRFTTGGTKRIVSNTLHRVGNLLDERGMFAESRPAL